MTKETLYIMILEILNNNVQDDPEGGECIYQVETTAEEIAAMIVKTHSYYY